MNLRGRGEGDEREGRGTVRGSRWAWVDVGGDVCVLMLCVRYGHTHIHTCIHTHTYTHKI